MGTLLTAVFASTSLGVFGGQGVAVSDGSIVTQFGVQLIGVITMLLFSGVLTDII